MKRFFIILILLFFPISTFAFNLWSKNVKEKGYFETGTSGDFDPKHRAWFYAVQISALNSAENPVIFQATCNQEIEKGVTPKTYYSISNSSFIFLNDWCDTISYKSLSDDIQSFYTNNFYSEETIGVNLENPYGEIENITNTTTNASFLLNKTFSYGDLIIIIFLSIFLIFGIFKFIWNFIQQNWNYKL